LTELELCLHAVLDTVELVAQSHPLIRVVVCVDCRCADDRARLLYHVYLPGHLAIDRYLYDRLGLHRLPAGLLSSRFALAELCHEVVIGQVSLVDRDDVLVV